MSEQLRLDLEGTPQREQSGPIVVEFDEGTLVVEGLDEGADGTEALTWDDRIDAYRAPAAVYRRLLGDLLKAGWAVTDRARAYDEIDLEIRERMDPYPHQKEGMEAWRGAERRGTIVLPTGSGKTYLAQMAIESVGRSTLVCVPTIDLMNQWSGVLEQAFHREVGLLGGGYHEVEALTVATYDSAAMHMERIGDAFGMLVFDEVHHLPSDFYRQAAEFGLAPFRLGLTATPERSDGREEDLSDLAGPIVYRQSIKDLSGDVLADYEIRTVEVGMTPEDKQRYDRARSFYRSFVNEQNIRMGARNGWIRFLAATNRSERGRRALQAYQTQKRLALVNRAKMEQLFDLLDRHRDEPLLIFTNDNESVWSISERALVPSITHQTKIRERREILERFNEGEYGTIVTSKVLNEGVDVPRARVGIVLSGSGSVREHVQRLGRILRRWEGQRAILYELVTDDTVEQHVSRRRREHDAYQ